MNDAVRSVLVLGAILVSDLAADEVKLAKPFRCAMVAPRDLTPSKLTAIRTGGFDSIALAILGDNADDRRDDLRAIDLILEQKFKLYYWIEVARNPRLADEHPEWMASLQGHPEWRRLHPASPKPDDREVTKNYPWVPIHYRESFDAHLARIRELLANRPEPQGIFLNDLQGAPSACGCGHILCRWTSDYGPVKTATVIGDDAAAKFVSAVKEMVRGAEVIPVWTTECEEQDGVKDGPCAGVACFKGICWRAFSNQLTPLAEVAPRIGVLTLYRAMERDLAYYRDEAAWVGHAIRSFSVMPPQRGGTAVAPGRLIAVVQGWDVTVEQLAQQMRHTESANAAGCVVAFSRIDQSWSPRIVARSIGRPKE